MRRLLAIILFLMAPSLLVAAPAPFEQGKDYALIAPSKLLPKETSKKILVSEFFSYGCPWCFHLEPSLEKWQKRQPNYVEFERVPVVFERGWQYYARAYYTAESLGLGAKFTPLLFNAVQKKNENLKSDAAMIAFFTKHGVQENVATSAFQSSPTIDAKLSLAMMKMQAYQVTAVPAIVVAGKYRTDLRMAQGDNKRLLQIVDYLVKKAKATQ